MIVPIDQLQPATLESLIEEFISRHGAVHGHTEPTMESQVRQVREQLRRGLAVIVFDEVEESCSIVLKEEATDRPTDDFADEPE